MEWRLYHPSTSHNSEKRLPRVLTLSELLYALTIEPKPKSISAEREICDRKIVSKNRGVFLYVRCTSLDHAAGDGG